MHFLVLTWAGRTFRFAESPAVVTDTDGSLLVFEEGLEAPDVEYTATIGGLSEMSEASIVIVSDTIDVPALLAEGVSLALAEAELSYLDGSEWNSREVRLRTRIDAPEYDRRGAPLAFGLRMDRAEFRPLVPPISAFFVSADEEKAIPLVFGSPSALEFGSGSTNTSITNFIATPAPALFSQGRAALAFHPVAADEVFVSTAHANHQDRIDTGITPHAVTWSQWSTTPAGAISYESYGVRWDGQYGLLRPTVPDEPVKTLGHLIEALLIMAGDCDEGRTAAAVPLLPFEVDGYISERVDLVDWLVSNVCSIFPVGLVRGPDGLYPIVLRAWLHAGEVVANFTEGVDCDREGAVVYESADDLKNDVQVLYGMDAISRDFLAQHLHTGDPDLIGGNGFTNSALARESRARFGEHAEFIESRIIFRPATAAAVAAWRVRRYAFPTREIVYSIARETVLEVGDPIHMTDSEMAIDHVCVVERRRDFPTESLITVRTMEQP